MLDPRRPGPDYILRWPRELFVHEARVLATRQAKTQFEWSDQVLLLLEEAFISDQPGIDFQAGDFVMAPAAPPGTGLEAAVTFSQLASELQQTRQEQFVQHLIRAATNLTEESSPRPYYPARQQPPASASVVQRDIAGAKRAWETMVTDLLNRGYLDRTITRACVDVDIITPDQADGLDRVLAERLGSDRLWHTAAETWTDDEFFGMVEVVHDVVARPRHRRYHSYDNCGYHYSAFAVYPAQILYRWSVNRLLRRYGIDLQLAKAGDDVGRLVHGPSDGRDELVAAALRTPGSDGDRARFAVSLFRSRASDVESKRSACIALAGVLESRRKLLKAELLSKDEGALFQIANQFGVRHQNADQRADYDEAYLDWLFWWYLATVELTNQLLTRQNSASSDV